MASLEQLYRSHGPAVLRRARQLLGNEAEAWDVLQEVFASLVHRPEQFAGRSSAMTFLYAMTTNCALGLLRRRRNQGRLLQLRHASSAEPASANADEASFDVSALHVFDLPVMSVGLGATLGAGWVRQSFETRGRAPARTSWLSFPGALVTLAADLGEGIYAFGDAIGRLSVFRQARSAGAEDTVAVPGLELTLGVSKRF